MGYVADLHIHSRFSRACSQAITIPNLAKWAKFKGIDLIGTGDCLHPLWFNEIKRDLRERGDGILSYERVSFILTTEVACIYTDKGKSRRIHIVLIFPSLDAVAKTTTELVKRRINIASDGRPITGLSSQQLCDLVWSVDPKTLVIPAHIWTPWFSLYGSKSGYDFLAECFGQYQDKIYAVETGLSSEPAMNWRIAELDGKSIVSFSDAHSLPNLGREATIFKGSLSFDELSDDLKKQNLLGTIEFFPEEGKYHYSGHRACNVVYSPEDMKKTFGDLPAGRQVCPVCGKELTIGVMQRVEDLATREVTDLRLQVIDGIHKSEAFPQRPGFRMLVGLEKIIAEAIGMTPQSAKVQNEFDKMINQLGAELLILTKVPLDKIQAISGAKVAEGVGRVREGKLSIKPGYDNTYGVVNIWGGAEEKANSVEQIGLF